MCARLSTSPKHVYRTYNIFGKGPGETSVMQHHASADNTQFECLRDLRSSKCTCNVSGLPPWRGGQVDVALGLSLQSENYSKRPMLSCRIKKSWPFWNPTPRIPSHICQSKGMALWIRGKGAVGPDTRPYLKPSSRSLKGC